MFTNFKNKETTVKIVYYGMGFGGKTTNINKIEELTPKENKSPLETINTEGDPTIYFDFMQTTHDLIKGWKIRVQLFTVPGQTKYNASRKILLKNTDGVVLVADSQLGLLEDNLAARDELFQFLAADGLDIETTPYVLQLNKRDLPNIETVEKMTAALRIGNEPVFEASAITGEGVLETNQKIIDLVLKANFSQ